VLLAGPGVVFVSIMAACGGGGLEQPETSTTRAATTTTTSPPTVSTAAGSDIAQAQERLNALGCDAGTADGALGAQTTAAVTRFQTAAGLEPDGVLGPATQLKLADAATKGSPRCDGPATSSTTSSTTTTTAGDTGPGPSPP
jgi:peptidoglycan hydrolase-like protein with peptidoglycan-binding domain